MDRKQELVDNLQPWAAGSNVTPRWARGTLRLENPDGTANATVNFPDGFWEKLATLPDERQAEVAVLMANHAQTQWPPQWAGSIAHPIDMPMSWLEDFD